MQQRAALMVLCAIAGSRPASAMQSTNDIRLSTVPQRVFKVSNPGPGRTESWYLDLVIADARGRDAIRPLEAVTEVFSGETRWERTVYSDSTLALMRRTSYRVTPETDALSLRRRFSLDEVFDVRLAFPARPRTWGADRLRITLTLDVPDAETVTKTLDVPLTTYSQRTELIFPIRGPAIVTQGPINNAGHAGHANQFAIDVMGLGATYGPMSGEGEGNAAFAGWGREVVAPADGKVVYARNDVPDNPPNGDPRDVYSQVPEPLLAIAGNCVVIDHGNGEFSALMHMRQGSVTVEVGDTVRQGQAIGRMGNSGDAFGVHLHYQLQDGPELFRANSLPVRFANLDGVDLVRGVYFDGN